MSSWSRGLLLALGCWALAAGASLEAQNPATAPDTARARRTVDSLIRVGAWRPPVADTVRSPPDTVRAAALDRAEGLHLVAFALGIMILTALAVETLLFAWRVATALDDRSPVGVRTYWGDFGAGNGGWEASRALTLVVVTVVLAGLTVAVATALLRAAQPAVAEPAAPETSARPAAAAPATQK